MTVVQDASVVEESPEVTARYVFLGIVSGFRVTIVKRKRNLP